MRHYIHARQHKHKHVSVRHNMRILALYRDHAPLRIGTSMTLEVLWQEV